MIFARKHKDSIFRILILSIAIIFVFDLFVHTGRPATFDALSHITNIAQFTQALKDGDFPVYWENGFANYGLPIGIVAQQLTSYLGAVFNLILVNPTLSFNILLFLGISLSSLFYYSFLRIYFPPLASFLGIFLFNFAPYRILNVYIRGAGPEVFSNIFLPLILISIYKLIHTKKMKWFILFIVFVCMLSLSHPFNLLIYSFIFIPYAFFALWEAGIKSKDFFRFLVLFVVGGIIGLGLSAYYLLPLNIEIRYFYLGLTKNQLAPNHFLGFLNFFTERWQYETAVDHITRGNILQTGITESALFLIGLALILKSIIKQEKFNLLGCFVLVGLLLLFFTTSISNSIYQAIPFLGNIQFPWRMLNGFIFIPPLIAAYLFSKKTNLLIAIVFILVISYLRFPQLYGKNFKNYSDSIYYFSQVNVQSDLMSTIWMDYSQNYPLKTKQAAVIEGKGKITGESIKNSSRQYVVSGDNNLRLVDYTFYFPGWKVYIDGVKNPIQFQDPNYRGLITYSVPSGSHTVLLKFEDSPTRLVGKITSAVFILIFAFIVILRKKLKVIFNKLY